MKIIKGDLILNKDTTFNESIIVKGSICGYFDLKVTGNIIAEDIDAEDIDAWNIDAWNIDTKNINARNIDARNIYAEDIIFCEKRIKKLKDSTTKAKVFIDNRLNLEQKEWGEEK